MIEIQSMQAAPKRPFRLPFSGLDRMAWARLGLTSLAALYAITMLWNAWFSVGSRYVRGDFDVYMASAQIVRDHGFAAVYDPALQTQYQGALLYPDDQTLRETISTAPPPYLPPFIALFLPFLVIGPAHAWWVWSVLNALVLLVYVQRLAKAGATRRETALAFALCLPAFLNLFYDEVEVWLLVCLGEALLAARCERNLRAGLWLAGLLFKPQTLLLFVPGLMLRREWRTLLGLGIGAVAIGAASLWLAGADGMLGLLKLITGYANGDGLASSSVGAMMSWRAVAWYLNQWLPGIDWFMVAIGASVITSVVALSLWLVRAAPSSLQYAQIWLGTYAATGLVAWHSHGHMDLPLVAPAMLVWGLAASHPRVLWLWLVGPLALFMGYHYVVQIAAVALGIGVWAVLPLRSVMTGMPLLMANLLVFAFTWRDLLWRRASVIRTIVHT